MTLVKRAILVMLFTAFMLVSGSSDRPAIFAREYGALSGSSTKLNNEQTVIEKEFAEILTRETIQGTALEMTQAATCETTQETAGETILTSAQETAQETTQTVTQETTKETTEETTHQTTQETTHETTQQTAQDTTQETTDEKEAGEKANEVRLLLSFAGDCTIGTDEAFNYANSLPAVLKRHNNDYSYFFGGVRQIFAKDDLTLVNLETTLTKAVNKADKKFRFKGKPDYVNILKAGSVEMVNISNNHIYDYLKQGFDETLKTLKTAGVAYSGEGHIACFRAKGKKIVSLGYKGWDMSIAKCLQSDIRKARKEADLVIVSFHWGEERTYYPNSVQTKLGRLSIDAGADIVVGHHPHVIQGIELYKGRYIVYSLGNFCFGGNSNPADKDSMIFSSEFTFRDNKLIDCAGRIIPCSISSVSYVNDYRPVILEGTRGRKVLDRIYKYSMGLKYGIRIRPH